MSDIIKVVSAANAAARWHASQKKKGSLRTPYINHLLEVAHLISEANGADDLDLIVAALLYDATSDSEQWGWR